MQVHYSIYTTFTLKKQVYLDLIRDAANLIKLLEVKPTKTLTSSHFKGISKFRNLFENQDTEFFLAQGGGRRND